MPDYTAIFRVLPSPDPAGWSAAPGETIELSILVLQGPCIGLQLELSPRTFRWADGLSFALSKAVSPPVVSGGIITLPILVPANASGSIEIGLGGTVTTRGAGWPIGGGSLPKDANAGPWKLTVLGGSGTTGGGGGNLTWFQARSLALAGVPIRLSMWRDRYLTYHDSLWWMQRYNPVTFVLGQNAPVQASEWAEMDFRASDWGAYGNVDPALLSAALQIRTVFPR